METHQTIKKNIAILGAGFAGVKCALDLEKLAKKDKDLSSQFNIFLIDKKNYHLYTPALYEVATTAKADASGPVLKRIVTTPIEEIIKNRNIKFLQAEVENLNFEKRSISFKDGEALDFEYLVLALGAEPAFFGIAGLKENSLTPKSLEDGIKIRNRVRERFLEKKESDSILKVIVGGSGPNGVEFASELVGYIKELNKIHNKKIKAEIKLIDGAPHILPGFEHNVVKKASKRLEKLGVKTLGGFVISKVDEKNAYLKQLPPSNAPQENFTPEEKTENYDVLIWSGGVQASNILDSVNVQKEKRGRAEVNHFLKCTSPDKHLDISEKIFAVGDNSCFYDPLSQKPVPGTAKIAIEQAEIAAINIYNAIKLKPKVLYTVRPLPFSIPIGGKYAITKWGPFLFAGFFGWVLKQLVELYYLYSITDRASVVFGWWRGIKIFSKND
ncbi:NAD(P)/FAD-dependent oxidoreductase [Candidatus Azambacteria bacterium]|nr:NAD(P)/FAD-dependent oxidoreductase [Candidatus Azambacteria bacterium]